MRRCLKLRHYTADEWRSECATFQPYRAPFATSVGSSDCGGEVTEICTSARRHTVQAVITRFKANSVVFKLHWVSWRSEFTTRISLSNFSSWPQTTGITFIGIKTAYRIHGVHSAFLLLTTYRPIPQHWFYSPYQELLQDRLAQACWADDLGGTSIGTHDNRLCCDFLSINKYCHITTNIKYTVMLRPLLG